MSVPIDRLYQFIEKIAENHCKDNVIIYRFWPHGSKNIQDLKHIDNHTHLQVAQHVQIICHDQEPLNYDFYQTHDYGLGKNLRLYNVQRSNNLRNETNIFDRCVLLHSEQGGANLEKYHANDNFVLAYYWSHALIARDWFRYAQHADFQKQVSKTFLIYCRAWTGTRQYRLGFANSLVDNGLQDHCSMRFCANDSATGKHYRESDHVDPKWLPTQPVELYFLQNTANSDASADFVEQDYKQTDIEVVLETLFDDDRIHLTEKTLRAIACGQPFILCAAPGSLSYLRQYGFQTFCSVWNEDYDNVKDAQERLVKVTQLMKDIVSWSADERARRMQLANKIARENQKLFFSHAFLERIINELETNVIQAVDQVLATNTGKKYLDNLEQYKKIPGLWNITLEHFGPDGVATLERMARDMANKYKA